MVCIICIFNFNASTGIRSFCSICSAFVLCNRLFLLFAEVAVLKSTIRLAVVELGYFICHHYEFCDEFYMQITTRIERIFIDRFLLLTHTLKHSAGCMACTFVFQHKAQTFLCSYFSVKSKKDENSIEFQGIFP